MHITITLQSIDQLYSPLNFNVIRAKYRNWPISLTIYSFKITFALPTEITNYGSAADQLSLWVG